jgi:hypothetical protein
LIERESLADDLTDGEIKPLSVVHAFAVIVTECLLIQVAKKVKGFHAYIRARNAAF